MGPPRTSYDVVIVGGGVIGSAIAYFLASEPRFGGSILVVERDPTYARAASALSVSAIRHQFSVGVNILQSQFGTAFIRDFHDHVAVDGDAPDLGFQERGYLFLATSDGMAALERNHAVQRAHGVDAELLDRAALAARHPYLDLEGIAGASFGRSGEGWFDGYGMLQGLRRKAQRLGAEYVTEEVVGLDRRPGGIAAITLASGARIACSVLVNAAGTRAAGLAQMAGVTLPVEPRKRSIYVVATQDPIHGEIPHSIDPTGIFWRREGEHYITGTSPRPDAAVSLDDFDLPPDEFETAVWPHLAQRIPQFEALKIMNFWVGHYDYNPVDQNAILGPHPEIANLLFANGFSGHGLQHAPAVGRGIAEWVTHGGYRSIDLSPLGYDRLLRDAPLRETLII